MTEQKAKSNRRGRQPLRVTKIGERFHSLTVTSEPYQMAGVHPRPVVDCLCDCGKPTTARTNSLLTGNTKSCGCLQRASVRARNTTHGQAQRSGRHPDYPVWANMLKRCNPDGDRESDEYKNYAGRGITVCERWRSSFAAFLEDMGPRPGPEYSIDRKDNSGNYEPGNCRWATDSEQMNNTRRNRRLTFMGETLTLREWAKRIGVGDSTLHQRLTRWPVEVALTMPKGG